MEKILFSDLKNIRFLSSFLCTKEENINLYLNQIDTVFDADPKMSDISEILSYRFLKMYILKKNRSGYRIVYKVQDEELKNIHKIIQKSLNEVYRPISCVHGYIANRSVATNARIHLGKKYLLKLDIEDFFPSIKKQSVTKCFIDLGFTPEMADCMATLTTLDGELVQGFNTSPILANLIVQELDTNMLNLCQNKKADYSRYADDLYISSNTELPSLDMIKPIIESSGFKINDKKTRLMKRGQKQFVTGLTIFDNDLPRIPKKIKNRIRFSLYYLNNVNVNSLRDNFTEQKDEYLILSQKHLKGWIDYVNAIEPNLASKYYDSFNNVSW